MMGEAWAIGGIGHVTGGLSIVVEFEQALCAYVGLCIWFCLICMERDLLWSLELFWLSECFKSPRGFCLLSSGWHRGECPNSKEADDKSTNDESSKTEDDGPAMQELSEKRARGDHRHRARQALPDSSPFSSHNQPYPQARGVNQQYCA